MSNIPQTDSLQYFQQTYPRYNWNTEVGSGTYGLVYKATDTLQNRKEVAIKKFRSTKQGEGISLTACREIALLRELRHENIIQLDDIFLNVDDKSLFLVFEYAERDLFEIIKNYRDQRKCLQETDVKSYLWQILNGINYLHQNWVIHRDLKPSNILTMADATIKIADFGLARIFQSPLRSLSENGVVVTIWYRAPELLLGSKHYTTAIDIWAIGCIFAELANTKPLFPGTEESPSNPQKFQQNQVSRITSILGLPSEADWPAIISLPHYDKIKANQNDAEYSLSSKVPSIPYGSSGFDLLTKMLKYNPDERITAETALNHPYFTEQPIPRKLRM